MKKTLLASVAIAALFAVPADAADMPIKAPPRAAVTTSWAGFYIGAHVGYGYANTAFSSSEIGLDDRIIGIGSRGWVAGGLAGYNMMLSPRWVGGIEVDGSWQDIKTTAFFEGLDTKLSLGWSASVRGRIGYLLTPTTMLFGTGGWSWSELKLTNSIPSDPFSESLSKSISGPQVGFGIETMYGENWIIRTEYLHAFYNQVTLNAFDGDLPVNLSPWVGVIRTALIYKPGVNPTPWPDRLPAPGWTGFYIGGLIGSLTANAKVSDPFSPTYVDGVGVTAVVPSALLGYNILVAPRFVIGLEGEIAPNISTSDVDIEWTGSVRVRGGILVTPLVLAYGTVGWGTAGIKNVTTSGSTTSIPIDRVHGFLLGSGIEGAVSDRWRVRADYQYFWSDTFNVTVPGDIPVNVKATAQAARIGLIYQIGGGP